MQLIKCAPLTKWFDEVPCDKGAATEEGRAKCMHSHLQSVNEGEAGQGSTPQGEQAHDPLKLVFNTSR